MNKDLHLKRQHFLHCDEELFKAIKSKESIVPHLKNLERAIVDFPEGNFQERLQSAIEVALRNNQKCIPDFLPYLKNQLPPIVFLTAVYTKKPELVKMLASYADPSVSHMIALESAAAHNDTQMVCDLLALVPSGNFNKCLSQAIFHRNEDAFTLFLPRADFKTVLGFVQEHHAWSEWKGAEAWMTAQKQRNTLHNAVHTNILKIKSRKM